jgi:hypothetical protein
MIDVRSKLRLSAIDRRAGRPARLPIFASGCAGSAGRFFSWSKITSGIVFLKENAPFRLQLWDAFYNFFDTMP